MVTNVQVNVSGSVYSVLQKCSPKMISSLLGRQRAARSTQGVGGANNDKTVKPHLITSSRRIDV